MFFRFKIGDEELGTSLDLTGAEICRLEKRLGIAWGDFRPAWEMTHLVAILETFLARTMDPQAAADKVGALTLKVLQDAPAVEHGRDDDLPDMFEDGLPKAAPEADPATG